MPQASYDWQVFNFDPVEDAFVQILRGYGLANVYGKRSSETRVTPSVELLLQTQQVQGHRNCRFPTVNSSLVQPYDTFTFTLQAKVTTNRAENGSAHSETLGRVRARLQYYWLTLTFTETISPYHSLTDIRESEAPTDFDNENNLDITQLTFSGMLNIRATAWPSSIS